MNTTWYEKGFEKGLALGQEQGQRKFLRRQLEIRFGPPSAAAQTRLQECSAERLDELITAIVKAQSLREMGLEE